MVNIIENRAIATGKILSVAKEPDSKGFHEVRLALESSSDLDEMPNLARADEGKDITIRLTSSLLDVNSLIPGVEISLAVRKAFGQVYFAQQT